MANGPSKTTGLAKFWSDFTCLAVSFFFFMKPVESLVFCKGKEVSVDVPISLFVSINFESRKSVDSSI